MPTVKVTTVQQTKTGGYYVCFNGESARFYVSKKIAVPEMGATIEANTSSKRFDNSKYDTWFLNDWKPSMAAQAPQQAATVTHPGYPTAVKAVKGWPIESGDLSRLASNLMASAIAAGLVKEPSDLLVWAAGAYRAAESLRSGDIKDFDDPIPQFVEPAERDNESEEQFEDSVPF